MAFSRAGQWGPEAIIDRSGEPQPGAALALYEADGVTLATRWTNAAKAASAANPWTTDANGNATLFAEPGPHVLIVTIGGVGTPLLIPVPIDPLEPDLEALADVATHAAASAAHAAAHVSVVPAAAGLASSDVQAALAELVPRRSVGAVYADSYADDPTNPIATTEWTAALNAACAAVRAAGGGVVMLSAAKRRHDISGVVNARGVKLMSLGIGSKFDPDCEIRGTAAGAQVQFSQRGQTNVRGMGAAGIFFNGNGVATNLVYVGRSAQGSFVDCDVDGCTGDNIIMEEGQNHRAFNFNSTNAGRACLVLDGGTGGHTFFGCEMSAGALADLEIRQTYDTSGTAGYDSPQDSSWYGGLAERIPTVGGVVTGAPRILVTAGRNNRFVAYTVPAGAPAADGFDYALIDVSNPPSLIWAADKINGPAVPDPNGVGIDLVECKVSGDPADTHVAAIKIGANSVIHATGHTRINNVHAVLDVAVGALFLDNGHTDISLSAGGVTVRGAGNAASAWRGRRRAGLAFTRGGLTDMVTEALLATDTQNRWQDRASGDRLIGSGSTLLDAVLDLAVTRFARSVFGTPNEWQAARVTASGTGGLGSASFCGLGPAPTTGTWRVGDWVLDISVPGAPAIRACTVAGTPGTWG